jgi:gliding motility-associated-like protein
MAMFVMDCFFVIWQGRTSNSLMQPKTTSIKIYRAFLMICIFWWGMITANSQSNFALTEGGSGLDGFLDIQKNSLGHFICGGYYSNSANFSGQQYYATGNSDAVLASYNNHILQWTQTFGGPNADRINAICIGSNDEVFVTGTFSGNMQIGLMNLTSVANSRDVFIAAFQSDGQPLWAKSLGGSGYDDATAISRDSNNNIYIAGYFSGSGSFGPQFLSSTINPETNLFSRDIFLTKINSGGDIEWTRQGVSENDDMPFSLSVNAEDQVFISARFSGSITFDQFHEGFSNLASCIVGFSANGEELFYLRILGGFLSLNKISFNSQGNIVLAGFYSGNILFLNPQLDAFQAGYSNELFICELDISQNILWFSDTGSENFLELNDLIIDDNNEIYVCGGFKCRYDELSLDYGPGSFNSIGFQDVFISKYSGDGNRLWQRQLGGREDEVCTGMVLAEPDNPVLCGMYSGRLILPHTSSFVYQEGSLSTFNEATYCPGISDACDDPFFRSYLRLNAVGATDAFLTKPINLNRQPLYFYHTPVNGCSDFPLPELEIFDQNGLVGNCAATKVGHTLLTCTDNFNVPWKWPSGNGTLYFEPEYVLTHSPEIVYTQFNNNATVSSEGTFWLNISSVDGCYNQTDSIDITLLNPISQALISDDQGVNFEVTYPLPVVVCNEDSVLLTALPPMGADIIWSGLNLPLTQNDSVWVLQSDIISISTTNDTCFALSTINVEMNNIGLPDLNLGIAFKPNLFNALSFAPTEIALSDTVYACQNTELVYYLYQESALQPNYPLYTGATSVWYHIVDDGITLINDTISADYLILSLSGNVSVTMQAFYECDGEMIESPVFSRNMVILVAPPVTADPITTLCPGTTMTLNVSGYDEFEWTGGNNPFTVLGPTSIEISQPGIYQAQSTFFDDYYACPNAGTYTFQVSSTSAPVVTSNPANAIICPGSFVTLSCNGNGSFEWYNIQNEIIGTGNTIQIADAGAYYCRLTNLQACSLNSNIINVQEYFNPAASLAPFSEICPGVSTTIIAEVNQSSLIQWQAPLSGNSVFQSVEEPGVYTFNYSLCGVNSVVSVTVGELQLDAIISGNTSVCDGDSILLTANEEMANYQWFPDSQQSREIYISEGGTWQVQVTDFFGCSALSQEFSVEHLFFNPVLNYVDSICEGGSINVNITGVDDALWYADAELTEFIQNGLVYEDSIGSQNVVIFLTDAEEACVFDTIPISIYSMPNPQPVIMADPGFCDGDSLVLSGGDNDELTYFWTSPDGTEFLDSDWIITNPQSGEYLLEVFSSFGCSGTDSVDVVLYENATVFIAGAEDIVLCDGDTVLLEASGNYFEIEWFYNDEPTQMTDDFLDVSQPGTYHAQVESADGCLSMSDSVTVDLVAIPSIEQLDDIFACPGDTMEVFLNTEEGVIWFWNDTVYSTLNPLVINGFVNDMVFNYQLISSNDCFSDVLAFNILQKDDCFAGLGNVFTPNGDGTNDLFTFDHFGYAIREVNIYDRWGSPVYSIKSAPFSWDGTNANGSDLSAGVFYYIVKFVEPDVQAATGYIQVLR